MIRNLFDRETNSYFKFDSKTWDKVGSTGTGRLGHYTTQGERTIYASPRKNKLGRHRFVISGTGYYPANTGGFDWGNETLWLPHEEAMELIDEDERDKYLEKSFSVGYYKSAEVENTILRGGQGTEGLTAEYPQLVRVRYYKNDGETRKTVEIEI